MIATVHLALSLIPLVLHSIPLLSPPLLPLPIPPPGIRYVVDAGREKAKDYDRSSGLSSFSIRWISQAAADQRAGRAGRTGPGHCYRLFSSALFCNAFPLHGCPEVQRAPIEGTMLQMKSMGIDKVRGESVVCS